MKNVLNYYYNLNPSIIHQKNNMYLFDNDNYNYVLMLVDKDLNKLNDIYNISLILNNKGIYTHRIIPNNQKNLTTIVNNHYYVLMQLVKGLDKKITIDDIVNFTNITKNINYDSLKKDNWYHLWINKIDYFEYQISELEKKYPNIKESFNYFSGLVELGISLLSNLSFDKTSIGVCHNRIKSNYTLFDLYNPFNFVIDYSVRDTAEYIKELFINEDPYLLIENYIKYNNLSNSEISLFFIRLLYPSFYFDLYEEIIENNIDDNKIIDFIKKADEYELLLKKTYTLIKSICPFPEIEWLN